MENDIKTLERELTALKTTKKLSSTLDFSYTSKKTLGRAYNSFKITYKAGDQPIITDIYGGITIWMMSTPKNNIQYIKYSVGVASNTVPNIFSTREILKVEGVL